MKRREFITLLSGAAATSEVLRVISSYSRSTKARNHEPFGC